MSTDSKRRNMRMKPILPSLRERKRYLVFEVISNNKLSNDPVSKAIQQGVAGFLGELEAGKAGMHFLNDKWNASQQKGIVRMNRKHVNQSKAALCTISKIGNRKVIVKSIGVSGTLKKAESKFMAA